MQIAERVRTIRLSQLTTLRVGGPALLWEVESNEELREAASERFRIIGAGSNILASDSGVPERVIRLGRGFNTMEKFDGASNEVWLGAATPLPGLVRRAQQAGLSGLEGLLGVPAVLGGAIAMNAGTRFGSMSDSLEEVELFWAGRFERLPAKELGLGYRRSALPPDSVITRARLRFTPSAPERVQAALARVDAARKGQPKVKSAGCAFKNPEGDSAGRLIDQAGLKGLRVGDAMVSLEHGNFIVNKGSASARDVLTLIDRVRSRISEQDGLELELEWRLWGF